MTQNQNMKETEGFAINWKGIAKWTVIGGVVVGAYYFGKKQGAKQEALKHVSATETTVTPVAVETPEI